MDRQNVKELPVKELAATLFKASLGKPEPATFADLKKFFEKKEITPLAVWRHFFGYPLVGQSEIIELLNKAVIVVLDLEWYDPESHGVPESWAKIFEVGTAAIPAKNMVEHAKNRDLEGILNHSSSVQLYIIEYCHMRNKKLLQFSEKKSLFAHPRFVTIAEAKGKLEAILNNQRCADGSKAPVILLGHGLMQDKKMLKTDRDWQFIIDKLESVVYSIQSISTLGKLAGIHNDFGPDGRPQNKKLDTILSRFKISTVHCHNAANDCMHELASATLFGMFRDLYPLSLNDYPADSSIDGRSIDSILSAVSAARMALPPPSYGYAQYCYYCDMPDDHWTDGCPHKKNLPPRLLCRSAPGDANKEYRKNAKSHRMHRCAYQSKHVIPPFPDWLKQNLNEDDLRDLCRALIHEDKELGWPVVVKALGGGRVGSGEIKQWDELKWFYERGEVGEVEGVDAWDIDYSSD